MLMPSGSKLCVRKSSKAQPQSVRSQCSPRISPISSYSMSNAVIIGLKWSPMTSSSRSCHSARDRYLMSPLKSLLGFMRSFSSQGGLLPCSSEDPVDRWFADSIELGHLRCGLSAGYHVFHDIAALGGCDFRATPPYTDRKSVVGGK